MPLTLQNFQPLRHGREERSPHKLRLRGSCFVQNVFFVEDIHRHSVKLSCKIHELSYCPFEAISFKDEKIEPCIRKQQLLFRLLKRILHPLFIENSLT